jgi:hypothetical protein
VLKVLLIKAERFYLSAFLFSLKNRGYPYILNGWAYKSGGFVVIKKAHAVYLHEPKHKSSLI